MSRPILKINGQIVKEIFDLRAQGAPLREIALKFNISKSYVHKILKKYIMIGN